MDTFTPTTDAPQIDLSITNVDSEDPSVVNSPLRYTLVITNNGPSTATGVTFTDLLPAGLTGIIATTSQGTVLVSGLTVTGDIGTLAPGAFPGFGNLAERNGTRAILFGNPRFVAERTATLDAPSDFVDLLFTQRIGNTLSPGVIVASFLLFNSIPRKSFALCLRPSGFD